MLNRKRTDHQIMVVIQLRQQKVLLHLGTLYKSQWFKISRTGFPQFGASETEP